MSWPVRVRRLAGRCAAALLLVLMLAGAARAEEPVRGELSVLTDNGFVRMIFRFDQEVEAKAEVSGAIMVISFKKRVAIDVDRLTASASDYISAARRDPDGTAIRLALARPVRVNTIAAGERIFIDVLPDTWKGMLPSLPQDVIDELSRRAREAEKQLHLQRINERQKKVQARRVKVVNQPTFVRYVFELPETANVVPEQNDGKLTLNFDQQVKWDLGEAKASLPATLDTIDVDSDFDSVVVTFVYNGTPQVRTFREDRSIVVDVSRDGAKTKVPGSSGPAIDAPDTVPAKDVQEQPKPAAQRPMIEAAASPPLPPPAPTTSVRQAAPSAPPPPPSLPPAPSEAPKLAEAPVPLPPRMPAPLRTKRAAVPEIVAPKAVAAAQPEPPPPPPPPAVAREPVPAAATVAPPPVAVAMPAPAAAPPAPPQPAAKAAPSASDPDAGVVAVMQRSGDNLRIEFPFATTTPSAVFRRSDTLWLVFDSPVKIDLKALTTDSSDLIRSASFTRGADGEALVRIKLERPRLVSLDNDGPTLVVNLADTMIVPTKPLGLARSIVGKGRSSIAIPFDHAAKVHWLADSDIGDRLLVITGPVPARGFLKAQDFVELRALPSIHGVVVQPIADDIGAELAVDKVTITRPGGLSISASGMGQQQQISPAFRALTFDTQIWGYDRDAQFIERQSALIRLAAEAPESKRKSARFNLARFYLARDMAAEAKAVIDVAIADQRGDDITGSVLKAVANVMLDRPEDALKDLASPTVGNQQDAPIWRAIAYSRQGRFADAREIFKIVDVAMGALPIELQRLAMLESLRAAIEVRDFSGATRIVQEFDTLGMPPERQPSLDVLQGRLYEGIGRSEDALASYRAAAGARDRRAAAQGRLREIVLLYGAGDMQRKDVIHELETLTTVWRGDETEIEGLRLLAHLYTEDRRYREAFHVMRTAMRAHPNSDLTRKIQDEAAETFDSLFLAGKGDALPPIEALGLFYDFRELTPIGRRGDEMIRRLADRLVAVDLLDQAAELLQHQVDNRLQGAARAQVATKLATIYLMNHKPDRALQTLQATRSGELANELRDQRMLLEARAMSDVGRHDLALELTANIDSREALRLRADIQWGAKRWREGAESIETMYGERWRDFNPLDNVERADILRAAIGFALAEDTIGLGRLREKYGLKFADGPDRRAFDVVSAPTGTSGAEFQSIARKVAGVDTLDGFLRDMKQRYPDGSLPPADAPADPASGRKAPAAELAPAKPAASSPLPAKVPAGVPLKPDPAPTGSITILPRGKTVIR